MDCLRCNKSLPKIEGMENCPFCGFLLDGSKATVSEEYRMYQNIHRKLTKGTGISLTRLEAIAADIARNKFGIKGEMRTVQGRPRVKTKNINTLDDVVIEYWHELCVDVIECIKGKL